MHLSSLLLLLACSGGEPAPAPALPPAPSLTGPELTAAASRVFSPSPVETLAVMDRAGITKDLSGFVPRRKLAMDGKNVDLVALRTGVVLADTVLILKDTTDEDLTLRMESVRVGLTRMGAGPALLSTLTGVLERHTNKGITRDEMLRSLDEVVSAAVPESGVGPDDRTGPLLQAGAWLATTNVAADAVLRVGSFDAAASLFHQQPVVDWFRSYVKTAGAEKADAELLRLLETTLAELSGTAAKPTFDEADVRLIRDRTATLLGML